MSETTICEPTELAGHHSNMEPTPPSNNPPSDSRQKKLRRTLDSLEAQIGVKRSEIQDLERMMRVLIEKRDECIEGFGE